MDFDRIRRSIKNNVGRTFTTAQGRSFTITSADSGAATFEICLENGNTHRVGYAGIQSAVNLINDSKIDFNTMRVVDLRNHGIAMPAYVCALLRDELIFSHVDKNDAI